MALTSLGGCGGGFLFPNYYLNQTRFETSTDGFVDRANMTVIDAANEAIHMIGNVLWADGQSHTVSTSGKFIFRPNALTWAGTTTLKCGFQGVSTAAGNPGRGDGVWGTYKELVRGTDTITNQAWNEFTFGSGSNSVAHGQLVAFVFELTVRGGSDAVTLHGIQLSQPDGGPPTCTAYTGGSYATSSVWPIMALKADDGTVGYLTGTSPYYSAGYTAYANTGTPDEYALYFQVPVAVKVSGLWGYFAHSANTGTADLSLYSSPTSSPAIMGSGAATFTNYGRFNAYVGTTSWRHVQHYFASEIELAANTPYCVGLKATSSANVHLQYLGLPNNDAAYRNYFFGGTSLAAYSRSDTGNFAAVATVSTYELPCLGVIISSVDSGGASSSGGGPLIGGRLTR